jgi:hypothetical protein
MNSNANNLCEDWGWFIDIESNNSYILKKPCKIFTKSNFHFNKLQTMQEDEYDYYQKYYENLEEKYDINENENENENETTKSLNTIFNAGSTTLLTALLTYVILFIL